MGRLRKLLKSTGAQVVAIWMLINLVIVSWQFAFGSYSSAQELALGWAMVGLLAVVAVTVLAFPRRPREPVGRPPGAGRSRNGAPAAAVAGACLIGGLAWVFGVYVAYLALPLAGFCLARWRMEWVERRQERRP